ncbi:sensor histidine kinase [Firmicutes bacterium AM43-11BH]|uniref:Heme sensor protein HssS n=1 Tax=Ruminococcus hominis TaxID=2763065 RepID=A0ABR7G5G6_9FIRM|nr:HAMP domain-containing sensor histidine kinase [Ruminococcus hominis]MBC5682678.1 HAMP domain-containing histidine kinase [Ruminococcus hominis]RHS76981.1 sensor histidine kinase [Firmicutes bacterium AM43-11BH]
MVSEGRRRIGTIRWAVGLGIIINVFAVASYLVMVAIRYYYFDIKSDNFLVWSVAIYQTMGNLCGVVLAVVSAMLYRRMEKLINGLDEVAKGNLDVELSLKYSGEYKAIYENFNRMVKELKNADEQQKQFMKDFSHEFKTPINSVKGMAEYLAVNELPKKEEKEYLNIMAKEAGRLSQLSQNTLLLSKLENMELIQKKEKYRLDSQIRNCAILQLPAFETKYISLEVNLPEIWYFGNEELLDEVWTNLLDNARKYSSEHTTVFINGRKTEEGIWIEVKDEGQGMDDDIVSHIFERYYQGDDSHETSGFGLGLSIVKRIVELSGGSIRVESRAGKGTSFFVYL